MDKVQSVYDSIGGDATLRPLIESFYNLVAHNSTLRPLFPADFTEIKEKQYAFLTQFFGGPALYAQRYGAPMLRMRHAPFAITEAHATAWLECMMSAMDDIKLALPIRTFILERLSMTAHHMVNTFLT